MRGLVGRNHLRTRIRFLLRHGPPGHSRVAVRRVVRSFLVLVAALSFVAVSLEPAGGQVDAVLIEAAGDIACQGGPSTPTSCHQRATSDILVRTHPAVVLTLGDNQYERGQLWAFQAYYEPTWGRVKGITFPSPGNHEYKTPGASGYFTYFGPRAGSTRGYYSFDVGAWHLVSLDSEIDHSVSSAQVQWLKRDLLRHRNRCTLAYWHRPRWSSGGQGSNRSLTAIWQVLYVYRVDLVLNGHDHDYERFAPQSPSGTVDLAAGIREFVVGTGGRSLLPWGQVRPNSRVRNNRTFGVLRLALYSNSYAWRFLPEAGKTWTDRGSATCH